MLRYHPLLEFKPPPAPAEDTAVVLYKPDALAVSRQTPSGGDGKNTFKPLLDFARFNNKCQRATLPLESFLRQVQDGRAEVEVALEEQTVVRCARLSFP